MIASQDAHEPEKLLTDWRPFCDYSITSIGYIHVTVKLMGPFKVYGTFWWDPTYPNWLARRNFRFKQARAPFRTPKKVKSTQRRVRPTLRQNANAAFQVFSLVRGAGTLNFTRILRMALLELRKAARNYWRCPRTKSESYTCS